ncbi:Serine phosphatase RsbU, regulator of sigma subunit [Chitinispirillum alkaliphilum]|nr:Serine phosphatase RsbU, regulator of sigma subunit [Chitinispirillum alkaliphilum]
MNRDSQKTICLFLEGLAESYYSRIWPGISDSVRQNGYNLVCYEGGSLSVSPENPYEHQVNLIYQHVDISKIDGLIMSGTIRDYISDEVFLEFLHQFRDIPIVTLTPAIDDIPSVILDNESGVRSILSHFHDVHGFRKYVFIGGTEGNIDADQRLAGFRKFMKKYGLEYGDERIKYGNYSREGGYLATKEFLDIGLSFDAIIAADDETAIGAIKALREQGLSIPEDVAVSGFDGIEESELTTPPLTTVRQPFYEIGSTAVSILIAMMKGREVPMRTVLNAVPVIRQSCGCFINPQHALSTSVENVSGDATKKDGWESYKERCEAFCKAVRESKEEISGSVTEEEVIRLGELFFDELEGRQKSVFLPWLNWMIKGIVLSGEDILQWQKILTLISHYAAGIPFPAQDLADKLLHDGYSLFSAATVRVQAHKRLVEEQQAALLRTVGISIANSFNIPSLLDTIERVVASLGIEDIFLSLYQPDSGDYKTSRLILNLKNGKRDRLPGDAVFESKDLIPGGVETLQLNWQLIVLPLYFKEEQLGFILFKPGKCKTYVYNLLSQHLSGAIQGALLMQKVQDQAIALEKTNKQLNILREQERKYLEAIKRELELGRKIQSSFLPETLPVHQGWESNALFLPAREVSGDFYDAFTLEDGRVAYIIADVSGKDVGAALFMSLIRTLVRAFTEQSLEKSVDPLYAVQFANRYIISHHRSRKSRLMYATMFFALVDPCTGELTYINAGHNPAALLSNDGRVRKWLEPTGPAVGIGEGLEFIQERFTLKPGETVLLYTDGVTEARNTDGEFFTREKLSDLLCRRFDSSQQIIELVRDALEEHGSNAVPYDDITMLAIRRKDRPAE